MESVRQAQALLRDGEPKKAGVMANKALVKLRQTGNASDVVSALEVMARAHCATNDYLKSSAILRDSRSEFHQRGEKKCEVLVTCLQAECDLASGDTQEALGKANEALELATAERDRMGEAAALRAKAKISLQTGNSDEAITVSKTVAHILHECKDFEGEALELLSVAELHYWLAQYSECVSTAKQAGKIFREVGHRHAEANALRVGAQAAWAQGSLRQVRWSGNDEGALPMALAALESYKEAGIVNGQIETRSMIAQVLLQMEDFEEAGLVAEEAIAKAQEAGNRVVIAESLKTYVHACLGRINARRSTATQKSIRGWADDGVNAALNLEALWANADKASQSEAQYVKGSALLGRGQALKETKFQTALEAADRSVELAQVAQQRKSEAAALVLKAQIHFAMKDINPAADALERADQIYKEDMDVEGLENSSALMRKFRSSYEWSRRKVKRVDGKPVEDVEGGYAKGATGLEIARGNLHIHFDNLRGRAAKNIG